MTTPMSVYASFDQIRAAARRKLPRLLFEYIDGGSYDEQTLQSNVRDFGAVRLHQRVLRDVSQVRTDVQLFGQSLSMPVVLSPVGLAGMYARRGEVQAARAAKLAGVPFALSSVSVCGFEEVAAGVGRPPWFQLYMIKDREYMACMLRHAEGLGSPVLLFTVDVPVPASRLRDLRTGLAGVKSWSREARRATDALLHPGWLWDVWLRGRPHSFGNFEAGVPEAREIENFWGWVAKNFEPRIDWDGLDWVRENWRGPIVLKGIMHPDDAREAVTRGFDGIVVSNHGGRQLNGAPSSVSMLPAISQAVMRRVPVLFDGGIRSGTDVLKALALGADACLIGRSWAMALAAGGCGGVSQMLEYLRAELRTAMALSACIRPADAPSVRVSPA